MVVKGYMRANVPFVFDTEKTLTQIFANNAHKKNWESFQMQGDFLLKHINISFINNATCLLKKCNKNLQVPVKNFTKNTVSNCDIAISEVQVYLFDTGIGFCSLHIPYDNVNEDTVSDICSILYSSVTGTLNIFENGTSTYLDCIANEVLGELNISACKLFGTANENALKRINMFSCVLLDSEKNDADCNCFNSYCYQLANTYDNRNKNFDFNPQDLYYQHNYVRWGFSTRGCSAVANLTGNEFTDNFLRERWFYSISTNYYYLYLMVLHEKFATHNFLNIITDDPDMHHFKINQKMLIDFNSKYIFKIVSDEKFIQDIFLRFKEATNADDAYIELTEQLKKMFDHAEYNSDKEIENKNQSLNLISIIISIVCSLSVIFDTMSLFYSRGLSLGFDSTKNALFTSGVILEIVLFIIVAISVIWVNKNKNKK